MEFKGSQTYQNLQTAYQGELRASTKYRIYGMKAKEDGYQQIGNIFLETSHNEMEHGEIWLKLLNGGEIPPTLVNLKEAAAGENYEWTTMYKGFADTARKEGYEEIADLFDGVARIENNHDGRFETLAWNIESGRVFCRDEEAVWICTNCGNLIWAECAPERCPVCGYPQGYYQLYCEPF
ncbi:MAG: ferritin family protein [Parabacteroides sp.]|nr:ferritin family protein [Parabacteroides sp.]